MVTIEQGIALLREFGFPVIVAVWFMWRLEKRLDRVADLMSSLLLAVQLLAKSVDFHILPTKIVTRVTDLEDEK